MQKREKELISSSWQKFLKPLVDALIAALAAMLL